MIVVALAALALPACSDYKDALVVNPCRSEIQVRFGQSWAPDDPAWWRGTATTIRAMTTQLVKDTFADVGPKAYAVLINTNGRQTLIHVADVGETILVSVPDSVC